MFREAWRLQRDQFWTADLSGIDWAAVRDRYLPLVERVATPRRVLRPDVGAPGRTRTSHCYEMGGDYRPEPDVAPGLPRRRPRLRRGEGGLDGRRASRGATAWDAARSSPLSAPGLGVREGDEIVAVDGEALVAGRGSRRPAGQSRGSGRAPDGALERRHALGRRARAARRAAAALPRLGRGQPGARPCGVERAARLRPRAQHGPARLLGVPPLLPRRGRARGARRRRALERRGARLAAAAREARAPTGGLRLLAGTWGRCRIPTPRRWARWSR